jgi:heparanase 1
MRLGWMAAGGMVAGMAAVCAGQAVEKPGTVQVKSLPKMGMVDARFQSYNVEMVEVTGGRFWRPFKDAETAQEAKPQGNQPAGLDPSLFEYRPPIDLSNAKLRKLAAALGPVYLRVSGTWANSTYFDPEGKKDTKAPEGFKGVLTGAEWSGVIDFAKAVDAELVTSFAVTQGVRDADGVWTPKQAAEIAAFTKAHGGRIAAAELVNEPTIPDVGGMPKGWDAAAFAKDEKAFRAFAVKSLPGVLLLGPGGVAEGGMMSGAGTGPMKVRMLSSADLLAATGPIFDVFSYHSYAGVSTRCNPKKSTDIEATLSAKYLDGATPVTKFYKEVRDKGEPGKPMWNTETAEAACGGDKWAGEFADSFRYLKQLGDLARTGVSVQIYNTLASSDYGLLEEDTYRPRPNYWAALMWHKLMGRGVLDAGASSGSPNVYVYAHCMKGVPGGVAVLAINADLKESHAVDLPETSERYTLKAESLDAKDVALNGERLALGKGDALPEMHGVAQAKGVATLAPESISFFALPDAGNASCRMK